MALHTLLLLHGHLSKLPKAMGMCSHPAKRWNPPFHEAGSGEVQIVGDDLPGLVVKGCHRHGEGILRGRCCCHWPLVHDPHRLIHSATHTQDRLSHEEDKIERISNPGLRLLGYLSADCTRLQFSHRKSLRAHQA